MIVTNTVLLGKAGSGKTTLAKELTARRDSLTRISSGDVARELAEKSETARHLLDAGRMAPEQAMRAEIRKRVREVEREGGSWVLDGFPRTEAQLILLMQWTETLPLFVHLDVADWSAIQRLTDRNRHDDNADSIAHRLQDFRENVEPLIAILGQGAVLERVGESLSPERAAELVLRHHDEIESGL